MMDLVGWRARVMTTSLWLSALWTTWRVCTSQTTKLWSSEPAMMYRPSWLMAAAMQYLHGNEAGSVNLLC